MTTGTISFLLFFSLVLGNVYCQTAILTNTVSYDKTNYYRTFTPKTTPTTNFEAITGALNSMYLNSGTLYMTTSNSIVTYKAGSSLSDNNSYNITLPLSLYINGLTAPLLIDSTTLVVASSSDPVVVAKFNATTLAMLDISDSGNYQQEPRVGSIIASFQDSLYLYFVGNEGIARYTPAFDSSEVWIPSGTYAGKSIKSAAFDATRGIFYLGSSKGLVIQLTVNAAVFSSSSVSSLTVNDANATDITAVVVDSTHDAIYVANAGLSTHPSSAFKLTRSPFAQAANVTFSKYDYYVSCGAMDSNGVLYFGTSQTPGRVIQIDLSSFAFESSLQMPNNVGRLVAMMVDSTTDALYVGGQSSLIYTQFLKLTPADACKQECYSHGTCGYPRQCTCSTFQSYGQTLSYDLPWCEKKQCASSCNNNGLCSDGLCVCFANYTGSLCDTLQCPYNCSYDTGNGHCIYQADGVTPDKCECTDGWTGDDCKTTKTKPCNENTDCSSCTDSPGCGWCADSNKCSNGNDLGVLDGTGCRNWHYQECPAGTEVINFILLVLLILLFLINMITYVWYQVAETKPPIRTEWYRFQRSCKAWTMVFQLQYIAITGNLAIKLPTVFLTFTRFWNWLVLGWGLPWQDGTAHMSSRALQNVEQYEFYSNTNADTIFIGILFWWGVVWVAGMLGYVVMAIIVAIKGRDDSGFVLQTSPLYISTRVLELAFFGIVTYSGAQIVQAGASSGMIVLSVVLLAVVGLGFPVAVFIASFVLGKNLWKKWTRVAFFPIMGPIQVILVKWMAAPILKRFFLGIIWGILSVNAITQLVLNLATQIAYLVINIVVQPYIDVLQRNLEIFLSVINTLSAIVLFGFLHDNLTTSGKLAITVIYIILQVVAVFGIVIFYFISWIQMHQIFTFNQLWLALTCRYSEEEQQSIGMKERH